MGKDLPCPRCGRAEPQITRQGFQGRIRTSQVDDIRRLPCCFSLVVRIYGMKRDMDLVRLMLLRTESIGVDEGAAAGYHAQCEKYPEPVRAHHIAIMKEAGLIIGEAINNSAGILTRGFIVRLTWQGHDFIDAARDDTIWKKVTEKVMKPAASFTFGILIQALKYEIKSRLGLPGDS